MEEQKHKIIHLLGVADRTLKRSISKKVENTGVFRSQHRLLMILGKHPDCSQTELAERLEISSAAVAVSLKKLEKSGFISRQCQENDNRVNQVVITEKGWEIIDQSVQYFKEMDKAFLKDFSLEELRQLEAFLERMIKNGEDYYKALLKQEEISN
ncbi:MAG: MarR family transcriptional regulator [Lachnospiraceae bacterium]|nr:MarR family transcriptional regulator [Lachnospiraceae bacterium]